MYIYKLTNKVNNKIYIGQTTKSLKSRMTAHKNSPHFKNTKNNPLARAIRKYGWTSFEFEVLDTADSIEELNDKEIFYIRKYNSLVESGWGYNLKGGGHSIGSHAEQTKRKIAEAQLGPLNHSYGKKGNLNASSKPLVCVTTGERYDCSIQAAQHLNLNSSHICSVCRGTRGSTGGFVFRWIDKDGEIIEPVFNSKVKSKKILNLDTGKIYSSITKAEIALSKNGKCNGNLSRSLKNKVECRYNGNHLMIIE